MISKNKRILRIIALSVLCALLVYFKEMEPIHFTGKAARNFDIFLFTAILLIILKLTLDCIALYFQLSKKYQNEKHKNSFIVGLGNLFTIISALILIFGMLSMFGMKPSQVVTSISFFAAAIAVIAKEFLAELIIGIKNGFSSSIDMYDYVKIGNQEGKVIDIGLHSVSLVNAEGKVVYIPNLKFYNEEVVNYSKADNPVMSIDFQLSKNHNFDILLLESKIKETLLQYSNLIDTTSIKMKITKVSHDAVDAKILYRPLHISQSTHQAITDAVMRQIIEAER